MGITDLAQKLEMKPFHGAPEDLEVQVGTVERESEEQRQQEGGYGYATRLKLGKIQRVDYKPQL